MKEKLGLKTIRSRFSWLYYVLTILLFMVLAVLPVIMFGGFDLIVHTGYYAVWFFLYVAAVALIFCGVTAYQKYQAFDKPMRMLSDAASRVASGDFSVYVKPFNPPRRQNDVDVMFHDFNKMVTELASLDTMKNDFIANVSHEFKTPLAVIQNYAEELHDETLDARTRQEYLDAIGTSAANLAGLVSNILRLNKIENQTIQVGTASFDLCAQLCECVASFGDRLDEKQLDFNAELEDKVTICADSEMLCLVWNNLLSNAIKFTEPGGKITMSETSNAESVTVVLSDSGCGMDEQTAKHIFDKFYQADSSHSKEGNGLGLALAHRVVELFGGSISVKSAPGIGSDFTVVFPRTRQ